MGALSGESTLDARIAGWRRYLKLSQQDLESRAGLSHNAISRIETGQVSPRIETVERIAGAMEISVEELQFRDPPISDDSVSGEPAIQSLSKRLSGFDEGKRREVLELFHKLLDHMRDE